MVRERRNWTAEEDSLLKNAVERARCADSQSLPWNTIALSVPGRTNKDCRKRFHYKVSSNVNRGAWTRTEDERLRTAVQKYGFKWSQVAIDVGTRNGDQCSKRWKNTIDPHIDRSAWSSYDEQLLIQSVEKLGHNWKVIVTTYFPRRTALQARNQYNQFCRRTGLDTQPSTPGSMQGPVTPLATNSPLSNLSAPTQPKLAHRRDLSTDTDLDYEESDSNHYDEDGNDDDDDADWLQNDKSTQWYPANEIRDMDARQMFSHEAGISPDDLGSLTSPIPNDGMTALSSFDHTFPDRSGMIQTLEQAPNPLYTGGQASRHNVVVERQSHFEWTNLPTTTPVTLDSSETRKEVVIAATCTNRELQSLMQTTAEALNSISFSVTSQSFSPTTESSMSLGGSKQIFITASCPSDKLGKLMQMVTDTMSSVSFTVNSAAT